MGKFFAAIGTAQRTHERSPAARVWKRGRSSWSGRAHEAVGVEYVTQPCAVLRLSYCRYWDSRGCGMYTPRMRLC